MPDPTDLAEAERRVIAFLDARPRRDDGTEQPDIARITTASSSNVGLPLLTADLRALLAEYDRLRSENAQLTAQRAAVLVICNELVIRSAQSSGLMHAGSLDHIAADIRQALGGPE